LAKKLKFTLTGFRAGEPKFCVVNIIS